MQILLRVVKINCLLLMDIIGYILKNIMVAITALGKIKEKRKSIVSQQIQHMNQRQRPRGRRKLNEQTSRLVVRDA